MKHPADCSCGLCLKAAAKRRDERLKPILQKHDRATLEALSLLIKKAP